MVFQTVGRRIPVTKNPSAASLTGFCGSLYLLQEVSHIEEVCYEVSVLTVDNVLPLVASLPMLESCVKKR
jgi:hypothetical protein